MTTDTAVTAVALAATLGIDLVISVKSLSPSYDTIAEQLLYRFRLQPGALS